MTANDMSQPHGVFDGPPPSWPTFKRLASEDEANESWSDERWDEEEPEAELDDEAAAFGDPARDLSWLAPILVIALTLVIGIAIGVGSTLLLGHASKSPRVARATPAQVSAAVPPAPAALVARALSAQGPERWHAAAAASQQLAPPASFAKTASVRTSTHRVVHKARSRHVAEEKLPPIWPDSIPVHTGASSQGSDLEAPH